jgi:four helix bundle protein
MQPFQRLAAGRAAHELTLSIYRATANWPKHELYGLTGQARRAAVSICANLSEGATRKGAKEYRRFIDLARGSHGELQYLVQLATDLGYLESGALHDLNPKLSLTGVLLWKLYKATSARATTE